MNVVRYKVSVEATIEREREIGHEWKPTHTDKAGNTEYGYTPHEKGIVRESKTIYEQTVASLDMASLVSVVNSLTLTPKGN